MRMIYEFPDSGDYKSLIIAGENCPDSAYSGHEVFACTSYENNISLLIDQVRQLIL